MNGMAEEEEPGTNEKKKNPVVSLQLGDVIKLFNEQDDQINEKTFYISYIDEKGADLIEVNTMQSVHIPIHEDGVLGDGRITKIDLIKRASNPGYARQHKLVPGTWVNIFFGGDVPSIVTGEITNLEEDMIELRLFPDDDVIYINFDYKGLPKDLQVESIEIREKPNPKKKVLIKDNNEANNEADEVSNTNADLDLDLTTVNNNSEPLKNELKDLLLQGNQIQFGHEFYGKAAMEPSTFCFNTQVYSTDLLNVLMRDKNIESIGKLTRSQVINVMINRFLALREQFSIFDSFGSIIDKNLFSLQPKPLLQYFNHFNPGVNWILPVIKNQKEDTEGTEGTEEVVEVSNGISNIKAIQDLVEQYESNQINSKQLDHALNKIFCPFDSLDAETADSQTIVTKTANGPIDLLSMQGMKPAIERYVNGEEMEIQSFIFLPTPIINFSRISLPDASIMTKANLNQCELYFWRIFFKDPVINDIYISHLDSQLAYNEMNFGNNIKNYILNTRVKSNETREDNYEKFVNIIVPKSRIIFEIMRKFISREFTFVEAVRTMEPFLIYSENITSLLKPDIESFLKKQIHLYKKRLVSEHRSFSYLKKLQSSKEFSVYNKATLDLIKKSEFKDDILEAYDIDPESPIHNSASVYLKMYGTDYGHLFAAAVTTTNIPLMFPKELSDLIETEKTKMHDETEKSEKSEENEECEKKKLIVAKMYKDERALIEDNDNDEIFFDKMYDKTNYTILDDYETEMQTMTPEDFIEYLPKALNEKYHIGLEEADYLADTLIAGMKRVKEGQYAVIPLKDLENKNKSDIFYFKRSPDHQWILDEDASKFDIETTDNDVFCNLQEKCIAESNHLQATNTCESLKLNKVTVQEELLNDMLDEFDRKYFMSKEKLTREIKEKYEYFLSILPKIIYLKRRKWLQYNSKQYKLGVAYEKDHDHDSMMQSPYAKLMHHILQGKDFVRKQYEICSFATAYTRDSYSTGLGPLGKKESSYWLYCIKTDLPLLPAFYKTLATCFANNENNYASCVWSIIRSQGVCDVYSNVWYDKYTGFPISPILLNPRTNISPSPNPNQNGNITPFYTKTQLVSSNEIKMINKIVDQIEETMGLSLNQIRDFIVMSVTHMLQTKVPSENEYNFRKEKSSQGSKLPSFYIFYLRNVIFFTFASILISIQTAIPEIKTRRTFPGCVRCFTGYPFDSSNSDLSSITYLANIALKQKQSADPWTSIRKFNKEFIVKGIKSALDQGLLQMMEVKRRIEEKKIYLANRVRVRVKREKNRNKYPGFLPPLESIQVTHLVNVTPEFKSSLLKDLKHGSANQRNKILVLESKVYQFSLAIQEKVNEIVQKKLDGINSCCEDIHSMTDCSDSIKEYNGIVTTLMNMLRDIKSSYVVPSSFSTLAPSDRDFPSLAWSTYDEKTIYLGLIQYCNLRNFCPIPDYLLPLCESKPDNIYPENTVEDIILKLKEDKIELNQDTFERMLQLVARHKNPNAKASAKKKEDNVKRKEDDDDDDDEDGKKEKEREEKAFLKQIKVLPNDLVDMLQKWHMQKDDKLEKDNFVTFFDRKISQTKKEIDEFLDTYKPCSNIDNFKDMFKQPLKNINWFYYIQRFGCIIPTFILNRVSAKKSYFPPSWQVKENAKVQLEQLYENEYSRYKKFYDNGYLSMILIEIIEKSQKLLQVQNVLSREICFNGEEEVEEKIMHVLFLTLISFYIHWIKEENENDKKGCFTLTEKDTIQMNNENLREFNILICDLLLTYFKEMSGRDYKYYNEDEQAPKFDFQDDPDTFQTAEEKNVNTILKNIYGNNYLFIE